MRRAGAFRPDRSRHRSVAARPRPTATSPSRDPVDRGSGTVLAVGVVAGLAVLLLAALLLVSALVAGQQARTAADLAALAAAGVLAQGGAADQGCARAGEVASRNGSSLTACGTELRAGHPWPAVRVTVSRDVSGTPWSVTSRAAAGAVPDDP